MLRSFLAMGAAALVALVVLADDARAGGCATCATPSPQASEQVWAAPQGDCYAPTTYCEEPKGCHLLDGLKCKMSGFGHGLKCKMDGIGHGLCGMGDSLKCKMTGLGHGLKCKLGSLGHGCGTPVVETCGTCETLPSGQYAAPQSYPAAQDFAPAIPAGQFPSGQ